MREFRLETGMRMSRLVDKSTVCYPNRRPVTRSLTPFTKG